jgi:hypothetical protein
VQSSLAQANTPEEIMSAQAYIKTLATAAILTFALGTRAFAQAPNANGATAQSALAASPVQRKIVVSLEDRKLALLENGEVKKTYRVAVGKPSTPSPVGSFTIERRVANPTYSHKGQVVQPGPGNPVGTRWMGLSVRGYGIHGTNAPKSIGKAASHGCIRMGKADLEELFGLVRGGDEVEIVGQRNEETARLFEAPAVPAADNAATQVGRVVPAAPVVASPAGAVATETATVLQSAGLMLSRQ